jgi:hypothetical protein
VANSCRIFADGFDGEGFKHEFDQAVKTGIRKLEKYTEDNADFRADYAELEENLARVVDKWNPPARIAEKFMENANSQIIKVLKSLNIEYSFDRLIVQKTCISIMKATGGFSSGVTRLGDLRAETVLHLEYAGLERSEAQRLIRGMVRLETSDIRDMMGSMDIRHVDFLRFLAKNGTPELKESATEAVDRIVSVKSTATVLPFRRDGQLVLLRPLRQH